MGLRKILLKVWKDPVGSSLISAGLIAFISYISLQLFNKFILKVELKILFLVVIVFLFFLSLFLILRKLIKKKEKLLLYVSSGGTCRDPIAKAITLKILEKKKLNFKLTIKAVGLGPLSKPEASYGARYVIKEMYHDDLLANHRAERITTELIEQADLILVMDKSVLLTPAKVFPKEKTFLFKSFFELDGDIKDPWPDGKDQVTLSRYAECANEIKEILENNIDHLIKMLSV